MKLYERYKEYRFRKKALQDALAVRREARRMLRRYRHRLSSEQATELQELLAALEVAIRDESAIYQPLNKLEERLEQLLPGLRRSPHREYAQSIGVAVLIALLLRAFVVEAFKIPSGSMIPTLQVGDFIFVNKFIYGVRVPFTDIKLASDLRKPRRGEVIVFIYPVNPQQDFIKRIAAVEGDRIEMRDNVVYVNGAPLDRQRDHIDCRYLDVDESSDVWSERFCDGYFEYNGGNRYTTVYERATPPSSFHPREPVTVPAGMVFVMGDNRDHSNDSRGWGFVPVENIKGKAMVIWWSIGPPRLAETSWAWIEKLPVFPWFTRLRHQRVFDLVH